MTITGDQGELRWGYVSVATIERWSFIGTAASGTVTGTLTVTDAFGIEQPGLVFQIALGTHGRLCRWPVRACAREGPSCRITVGEREVL